MLFRLIGLIFFFVSHADYRLPELLAQSVIQEGRAEVELSQFDTELSSFMANFLPRQGNIKVGITNIFFIMFIVVTVSPCDCDQIMPGVEGLFLPPEEG